MDSKIIYVMRGMSIKEFNSVLDFIFDFHRFGNLGNARKHREEYKEVFPNMPKQGLHIKYVDSVFDSRSGDIWSITFRNTGIQFRTNMSIENYDNLYDLCMDYLKGNYKPEEDAR